MECVLPVAVVLCLLLYGCVQHIFQAAIWVVTSLRTQTMLKVATGKGRNTGIVGRFKAFELPLKYLGLGV